MQQPLFETGESQTSATVLKNLMQKCETVSSAYAKNNSIPRSADWFMFKLQEELGELTKAYVNLKGMGRKTEKNSEVLKSELTDELADVLGHVLLFAQHHDIDLDQALQKKWLKHLPLD